MRDDKHKLKQKSVRLDIRRNFFPVSAVRQWTSCQERLCHLCPWKFSRHDWTQP